MASDLKELVEIGQNKFKIDVVKWQHRNRTLCPDYSTLDARADEKDISMSKAWGSTFHGITKAGINNCNYQSEAVAHSTGFFK